MKQFLFPVLILCLCLTAQGQDLIISEVSSGTPDFVELHNPTASPINPVGYTLWAQKLTECPGGSVPGGPNGGGYTFLNLTGHIIPPGGYYIIEDDIGGSAPGSPATVALGERTGFNYDWGSESYFEVSLYNPAGAGIDYIHLFAVASSGYPLYFEDEVQHNNPPDTLWLSGPVLRADGAVHHAVYRVNLGAPGAPSYPDNDVNTDWATDVATSLSPGADNPSLPSMQVLTRGVDLAVRENPGLSVDVAIDNPASLGTPAEELWILISFTQPTCPGQGPAFGLSGDAFTQLFAPVGSLNHPTLLAGSASNTYISLPTPGVITTLGLTLELRAVVWSPGVSLTLSNIVRCPDPRNPLNCP